MLVPILYHLQNVDENISNQFYISISVLGIPYIYCFSKFILSRINVYGMWWALSIFIMILTYNVHMTRINIFINFKQYNLLVI